MNRFIKTIISLLILFFAFNINSYSFTTKADSLKELLCSRTWHLSKLTHITDKGQSVSGEVFDVNTKFNTDGTLETTTKGKVTTDVWTLDESQMIINTNHLKDPKTVQEKIKIIKITPTQFVVQITYKGNNIMQYDYR